MSPDRNVVDSSNNTTQSPVDKPGKVGEYLGTGKHARIAIVWQTIKLCFFVGIGLIVVLLVASFLKIYSFSNEDIKMIWAIFAPIIMAALGYIFGKGAE